MFANIAYFSCFIYSNQFEAERSDKPKRSIKTKQSKMKSTTTHAAKRKGINKAPQDNRQQTAQALPHAKQTRDKTRTQSQTPLSRRNNPIATNPSANFAVVPRGTFGLIALPLTPHYRICLGFFHLLISSCVHIVFVLGSTWNIFMFHLKF